MASLRVAVVAVLLACAATARAEDAATQVERLAADAVNAYKGADYNRAIELLQRAYEIRQVPALLYNMAKAYDKLGDVEKAYESYRRYDDSADADARLKAKSEARMAALESRYQKAKAARAAEQQKREAPPPPTVETPAPAPVVEKPLPPPPTAEEIAAKLRAERQRERRRDRFIALGIGAGAVAFAAVAVGFSVSALQEEQQWSSGYGTVPEATRREQKDTALQRAAIADGFYAATAVAAGVAAYFVYRGFRPEPNAPSLALVPAASLTGGALVMTGRF